MHYPSTNDQNTLTVVNFSKYLEENREVYFHHHCQACYFDQDQILFIVNVSDLMQNQDYFINRVKPA